MGVAQLQRQPRAGLAQMDQHHRPAGGGDRLAVGGRLPGHIQVTADVRVLLFEPGHTPAVPMHLGLGGEGFDLPRDRDRKSTRLNSSHVAISYAVFCLKKKKKKAEPEKETEITTPINA